MGPPASLPYTATLSVPSNDVTVTNTVTCDTRLTLVKQVVNGNVAPTAWTLSAIPPTGSTLSGQTGAPAITNAVVTPNITYQLAESGGDPRYVQDDNRTNLQTNPLSTGSMTCVQIDANGNVIPGYSDGINGGVSVPLGYSVRCTATNRTAPLILIKHVVNDNGGTQPASELEPDRDSDHAAGGAGGARRADRHGLRDSRPPRTRSSSGRDSRTFSPSRRWRGTRSPESPASPR